MQSPTLSLVLFIFLSFLPAVSSAILHSHRSSPISIPLRRVDHPLNSSVLHSSIIHQQHVNRGVTRRALMSGRTPPSDYHLLYKINERIARLPAVSQARYNRNAIIEYLTSMQNYAAAPNNSDPDDHNDGLAISHTPKFPHSIGLDIQARDVGYIGTIQIGTPSCDFHLLMDSGSADLWVGGEGCQSDAGPGCGMHKLLGAESSSTFKDTKKPWQIYYGSGNVSGTIVQDKVTIAGLSLAQLVFGVVYYESMEFGDLPFDGIMGLAQSTISQQNTPTVIESLRSQGLIKEAIVSYKIPRLADFKYDGEMTIGALDPTKYDHRSLVMVKNVNRIGFWETPITSIQADGKAIPGLDYRTGILDTGTTLIIAPQKDVDAIHGSIPGAYFDESWIIPCTTNVTICLRIKKKDFCIDPRDLPFLPVDVAQPDGNCFSGITPGDIGPFDLPTEWLVGDVFLKNVYFSTNGDKNEISIAKTS